MQIFELAAENLCRTIAGKSPDYFERPGGLGRKTVVAVMGQDRFVISQRASAGRAALEAAALQGLATTGFVPGFLGKDDELIAQEYVVGERLSAALDHSDHNRQAELLRLACDSLLVLQSAAGQAGLTHIAPKIGKRVGWIDDLLSVPQKLACDLGLASKSFDREAMRAHIMPLQPVFVKWDARPGNALLRPDGRLCWFDWEHCGLRNSVDDIVWLLADEWAPDAPQIETHVLSAIAKHSGQTFEAVSISFYAMAVLHSFVRLSLIAARKSKSGWWPHEECLRLDKIGVTPQHVDRLCDRGARWAEQALICRPLADQFQNIRHRLLCV